MSLFVCLLPNNWGIIEHILMCFIEGDENRLNMSILFFGKLQTPYRSPFLNKEQKMNKFLNKVNFFIDSQLSWVFFLFCTNYTVAANYKPLFLLTVSCWYWIVDGWSTNEESLLVSKYNDTFMFEVLVSITQFIKYILSASVFVFFIRIRKLVLCLRTPSSFLYYLKPHISSWWYVLSKNNKVFTHFYHIFHKLCSNRLIDILFSRCFFVSFSFLLSFEFILCYSF